MISEEIRAGKAGGATEAAWLDEDFGPLAPRNIYGVTKLEAERLCRRVHDETGLAVLILRTGRFFPEEDDTHRDLSGENTQGQRVPQPPPHRRGCRRGACRGAGKGAGARLRHLHPLRAAALRRAEECEELIHDAPAVIARHFPDAPDALCPRGLVAARLASTGSTIRRAPSGGWASAAAPISPPCSTRSQRGGRIALRPRSLLCLAQGDG